MCGIAGIVHRDVTTATAATAAMTAAQRHRGPDADGVEVYPFGPSAVGLGHRRLAIQDLSPLGRNPMTDPSGNVVVFNGEIYNVVELRRELQQQGEAFRSTGDTEVMLRALTLWGVPETLKRLEGMYAFAFLDRRNGRLTLARDPLGIKPLYLADTAGGGVAFASEVRGLLASGLVPKRLDRRGLAGFLAFGAVQHPFTLFDGVRSLPPGTFQQFAVTATGWTRTTPEPFWAFPAVRPDLDEPSAVSALRDAIDAAVRDHLIADVPVGVFLSGGLDSTVIAGLAAKHSPSIQGFTVGFSDNPDLSEMSLAADTAKAFGLRHVPINLPAADAEAAAVEWLAVADQPSIDGLNTFVISKAVRREGMKVALSGLGADELFGGYPSFRDVPKLASLRRRIGWLPSGVRRGLAGMLTARKPRAVRRKLSDMLGGAGRLAELYFHRRRTLSNPELADFGFDAPALGLTDDFQDADTPLPGGGDPVRAVSELESRFYQGNMLLRDSDVMGMAHGLEIRVPFLDRRLLDLGHAVPGGVRLPPGSPGKHLLRTACGELLRPELTNRPKTGFTLPVARWMLGPLRGLCEQSLAACTERLGLPAESVGRVWAEFGREPSGPQWTRALALVAVGDFARRHDATPA